MKSFFHFSLAVCFLLLFYLFYRLEILSEEISLDYYHYYFFFLILSIFIFIIALYLRREMQQIIIIIITSIIFSLYVFEGYLHYNDVIQASKKSSIINNYNYDRRSLIQFYQDFKKKFQNASVAVAPSEHVTTNLSTLEFLLPLSGVSKSNTVLCNESGYYSIYKSDRYGFNNPDKEWESKKIEYLLVGDSLTQGACVNRPNDISSVLRSLSKKSVLNLGYSGNDPLLEFATLREYIKPGVKKVLWIYDESSDLRELATHSKSKLLSKYIDNLNFSQNLKSKQHQIDRLVLQVIELQEKKKISREKEIHDYRIVKFFKLYKTRTSLNSLSNSASIFKLKKILELSNDLVTKNNSKLYFVYLPQIERYSYKFENSKKNEIKKIVENLNITFIDIDEEVFKKEKNPLELFPFEFFLHYNSEGYRKVAIKIYEMTN
jgi:hypothetical protein